MKKQQSGFTLVEVAIVMVIIGLLLGGVLKGQEVITNARLKNINNDFSGISAAIYSYQDRYSALPGDDIAADAHVGAADNGDGDGSIEGTTAVPVSAFASQTADEEVRLAWTHLRGAGLVSGEAADQNQAPNAFNGIAGIATGDGDGAGGTANGIAGLLVGFNQIEGNMAVILDEQNDDGNGDTGTVRSAFAIGGAGTYVLANTYSLVFEL